MGRSAGSCTGVRRARGDACVSRAQRHQQPRPVRLPVRAARHFRLDRP